MNSVSLTVINKRAAFIWTFIGLTFISGLWFSEYLFKFTFNNHYEGNFYGTWIFLSSVGLLVLSLVIANVIDARNEVLLKTLREKNDELVQSKLAIEQLQKYKEQFFANISHELRTPLTAIKGVAQLLEESNSEEERHALVSGLKNSSEHLLELINDILDFSKLNAGKLEINKVEFSISQCLANVHQLMNISAKQKGVNCTLTTTNLPKYIIGDANRLNQILFNMIGNAIKFTKVGAVLIVVEFTEESEQQGWLKIKVRDTGIGIAADKVSMLFEDYTQADAGIAANYGGTGLGLSITKKLVALHGGTIQCSSVEQEGTTFTIEIPYAYANPSEKKVDQPISSSYNLPVLNILIADDNHFNVLLTEKIIQKQLPHLKIFKANNGYEAIKIAENNAIDIILMDVKMPEMDGIAATKYIRSNSKIHQSRILALTANTSADDINKCLAAGMNDYLSKPFTKEDLLAQIEKQYLVGIQQVA
jgi:signal transduction histidine kinase/CheY-like chemotaxis protein